MDVVVFDQEIALQQLVLVEQPPPALLKLCHFLHLYRIFYQNCGYDVLQVDLNLNHVLRLFISDENYHWLVERDKQVWFFLQKAQNADCFQYPFVDEAYRAFFWNDSTKRAGGVPI